MGSVLFTGTQSALTPLVFAPFTSAAQSLSPPPSLIGDHGSCSRCHTRILLGLWVDNLTASSTRGWYDMGAFAPSMPHDEVRMATGREASMRWARALDAKPPKTMAWTAPRRLMA